MTDTNIIPALWAAGAFEAAAPFDQVVDPAKFYTVEAIRTIPEMQALKLDLYKTVFQPAGVSTDDYQSMLEAAISTKAVVIALTSRGRAPAYVLSTYLISFPMVDGVIYERYCIISDLGACPPALKDRLNSAIDHFNSYIKSSIGIETPNTVLGTIPTRGYVSKAQSDAWEETRKTRITVEPSDVVRIEQLTTENQQLYVYVKELEDRLKATNP